MASAPPHDPGPEPAGAPEPDEPAGDRPAPADADATAEVELEGLPDAAAATEDQAEAPAPAPATPPAWTRAVVLRTVRSPSGFTATHVRAAPSQGAASLRLLPNGSRVEILGPMVVAEGFRWQRVRTMDGVIGWAVAVALV